MHPWLPTSKHVNEAVPYLLGSQCASLKSLEPWFKIQAICQCYYRAVKLNDDGAATTPLIHRNPLVHPAKL